MHSPHPLLGCAMANGRNSGRKTNSGRDAGRFVAIPLSVLDCPGYARLSMHARALLLEVARQFTGNNNGRLLLSRDYMAKRSWKSNDMLTKAKRELLDGGFLHETVKGHRPNKASWYAMTWQTLDRIPGYDEGAIELFRRGAYNENALIKNVPVRPLHGTVSVSIGPPNGTGSVASIPSHGAIKPVIATTSVPPHGHHLEMPSAGAV